ncbi:MAG: SH3 domain-containing protein [Clostridiales bacterium]|nr:SH3 domain-containing protein [Clostridiales bacterium]
MKRILALALAIVMCLAILPALALAATSGDFEYVVNSGAATITKYTGTAAQVTIPATLGGSPVTAIGNDVFSGKPELTGVTIPGTVTTIGDRAFNGCANLSVVTIQSTTIRFDEYAFYYCENLYAIYFEGRPPTLGFLALTGTSPDLTLYFLSSQAAHWPVGGATWNGIKTASYTGTPSTPGPTSVPTASPTPSPTLTASPVPTASPTPSPSPSPTPTPTPFPTVRPDGSPSLLGDVNCDGRVTAADAALILRWLVQLSDLGGLPLVNAKVTRGTAPVSAADAAAILRFLVDIDTLPPATPDPNATPRPTATPTPTGMTPSPTPTATPTPTPASTPEPVFSAYGFINATDVNFREGPGTNYTSMAKLAKNTQVGIYESRKTGVWNYVIVLSTGKQGWVSDPYVTRTGAATPTPIPAVTATPTPAPTATPAPPAEPTGADGMTAWGTINASILNLREGPGTQHKIIKPLTKGTVVYLFVRYNNWYYVQVKTTGERGWISDSPSYVTMGTDRLTYYGTIRSDILIAAPLMPTASATGTELVLIPAGTKVGILAQSGDWYKVRLLSSAATVGYVQKIFFDAASLVAVDADVSPYLPGATPPPVPGATLVPGATPAPGVQTAPDFTTALGSVNAATVYLRSAPLVVGTSPTAATHNILSTLTRNQALFVFEKVTEGSTIWYRVQTQTTPPVIGYCLASGVTLTNTRLAAFGEINPAPAPLRATAAHSATLLATLNTRYELVGILSQSGDWYKVRLYSNGLEGFILKEYINLLYNVDTAPSAPAQAVVPVPEGVRAQAVTTSSSSNLYTTASTTSALIVKMGRDIPLYVLEMNTPAGWHKVQGMSGAYAGLTGFVQNSVISLTNTPVVLFATTASTVTVRSGAGQNFPALLHNGAALSLAAGTQVGVLSTTGGYCKIRVLSLGWEGFVPADALTGLGAPAPTGKPWPEGLTTTATIPASYVNLRPGPSTQGAALASLERRTELDVHEKIGDWYRVTVTSGADKGQTGYVFHNLITLAGDRIVAYGAVQTNFAVLRATASAGSASLCLLTVGQNVGIIAETGDWYKVRVLETSQIGYVPKSALTGIYTDDKPQ